MIRLMAASAALLAISGGAILRAAEPAAPAPAKVSYYTQIRPIFQAACHGCHQPAKAGGLFVMTTHEALVKGGESGEAAIVPGDPAKSHLVEEITPKDGKAEMPKGKAPLAAGEIELIARWIAEGAVDDTPASAKARYDMEHPPVYTQAGVITALDYSRDGQMLAVSGFHEVLLHSADGGQLLARLVGVSERIESIRFSPDGKYLAVTGGLPCRMGEVQIWDVANRKLVHSVPVTYDTVYGASWSHDGKRVAFACADNTVRAIDAETGQQVFFNAAHNDWVLGTVFSIDSSHLVSVSRDRSMKLFILAEQRFVDNITSITPGALKGGLAALERHPTKDELLVGGSDGIPKTYLMHRTQKRVIGDDFQKIRAFDAMPGRVFATHYSPDGALIAAGSSADRTGEVRLYKADDGKLMWRVEGGPVYALAYSPDGKTVASGGFDGQVRLFDASSGAVLKEFTPFPLSPKTAAK